MDNQELEKIAKEIQQECHKTVEGIIGHPDLKVPVNVQDATNVFLFGKLAEFELRLRKLESASIKATTFINRQRPLK